MTLSARGLSKHFGGVTAVREVTFQIADNAMVGIIGPNGAGKTTLFNLLTGFEQPDAGDVYYGQTRITSWKPYKLAEIGMTRTFQIVRPFKAMSVLDNVKVAQAVRNRAPNGSLISEILRDVGLIERPETPARLLTHGELKKLELARALATEPKLLLLDEPFGGLASAEVEQLTAAIRKFQRGGGTVLIIEHRLRELMKLVQRAIVMDQGEVIFDGEPSEAIEDSKVIGAYLGSGVKSVA